MVALLNHFQCTNINIKKLRVLCNAKYLRHFRTISGSFIFISQITITFPNITTFRHENYTQNHITVVQYINAQKTLYLSN